MAAQKMLHIFSMRKYGIVVEAYGTLPYISTLFTSSAHVLIVTFLRASGVRDTA